MTPYLTGSGPWHRSRARSAITSVVGGALLAASSVLSVAADASAFGPWLAPTAVSEVNTAAHEGCPIESPDGKHLFIASTREGGYGKNDIWVASRSKKSEPFGPMVNLGSAINSADHEFCPTPLKDGRLLFVSDRTACGATPGLTPPVGDIYITRQTKDGSWKTPRHLGCVADGSGPNFIGGEFGPSLVRVDGVTYLYFSSTGTTGQHDIYRSIRSNDGTFGTPQAVTELNSAAVDQMPNVSADGSEMVFASSRGGNMDIYTATFNSSTGLWSTPVPVTAVNTLEPESRPSLSGDGKRLYFGRGVIADIYVSTRHKLGD
jgi:Tol biopolymer transport system component